MKPFYRMYPAYRHGKSTPWGGDALRRVFGKDIPDDRTGEALEASTLKGMESTTDDGRTLTQVAGGELPLLLKLIDARVALSVQVHPDDLYADANENGKLGKTEAWLILRAEPGAKLVYGLKPGTDVCALNGKEIEDYLNWVDVRAGDVFYIPAGMVHAIGAGILLYEIQQTSDITYRFWDWDWRDERGEPRPLHWNKACDVARADLQMEPVRGTTKEVEGGSVTHYLNAPFFALDKLTVQGRMRLPRHRGFQFITALGDALLVCGEERLALHKGETVYIPPNVKDIAMEGACELIRSVEGGGEEN